MKNFGILSALAFVLAFILSACGGGGGLTIGPLAAMEKTEGDAPFALVAPTSESPAAFTYSSSDPKVATIAGNMVTVLVAGSTTITASQASTGQWSSSSTSAVLKVLPRTCTAPLVAVSGACVAACVEPAVRQNGACVAPAGTGTFVTLKALRWMPATFTKTWADADAFCSGSTISGTTGWRLATEFELAELANSSALAGQGWVMAKTWTSTKADAATSGSTHLTIDLANPGVASAPHLDANSAYVTCVKNGS